MTSQLEHLQHIAKFANQELEKERYASTLITKNIRLFGKRTSIRLEPAMWNAFEEITERECCSDNDLCSLIYMLKKKGTSMTAAIRVFITLYFRAACSEDGHIKAGHGDFYNMVRRARIDPNDFDSMKKSENRIDLKTFSQLHAQDKDGYYKIH